MQPFVLESSAVRLEVPGAADVEAIVEACQDPVLQRFTTVPRPYAPADARFFLERIVDHGWATGREATWGLRGPGSSLLLGVVNLRGVRESGAAFSVPTYVFIVAMLLLIGVGLWRLGSGHQLAPVLGALKVDPVSARQSPGAAAGLSPLTGFALGYLLLRGFADRGGTVLLSSHLLAEVEAVADRMMIIGGGRIQAQGTRAELLTESGTIVEAADLAALDAALHHAGLTMHPADGDRRLVEAEPEVVARLAMANDVVLRRLAPAEDAGLERLFFELTTAGGTAPSSKTDPIHAELAGATS